MNRPRSPAEQRILVLLPDDRTVEFTGRLIESLGVTAAKCADLDALIGGIEEGAGAVLVMEEALRDRGAVALRATLERQASWSDLPVLIVAASGTDSPVTQWAERGLRNVTLLERPIRIRVQLSALRTALVARQRQYQLRDQMEALRASEERERARATELEGVMRATPTAIWIAHDRACLRMTGNPASYELVRQREGSNVSASARAAAARGFREYRNGVPIAPEELPLQRAAAQGVDLAGEEFTFRFDDGTERHVYGNAVPLWNADGTVRGAVGAFVDITSLKQSQAMLQRRTEGLRLLADAAAMVLTENDPDATVNSLFERIAAHAGIDLYASFSADPAARRLRLAAARGLSADEEEDLTTVPYGEAVCGAVAERGVPVVVNDVQSCDEPMAQWLRRAGVTAYVSFPLIAGGRLLGTLAFGSRTQPRLAADEVKFLGTQAH